MSLCTFEMQSAVTGVLNLALNGEDLTIVDRFSYLSSLTRDSITTVERSTRISKTRAAYGLKHLCHQIDSPLKFKGRVHCYSGLDSIVWPLWVLSVIWPFSITDVYAVSQRLDGVTTSAMCKVEF